MPVGGSRKGSDVDQATALVLLSEKDLEITRATKRLDELPEKQAILDVRHKLRDIEAIAVKAGVYVGQLEAGVKRAEDEAAMIAEKISAEQAKVDSGSVTNHKELQSLSREIDSLSRQKDKKENEVLSAMEKLEAGKAQATKVAETIEKAKARETQLITRFQEVGGGLQRDIDRLQKERAALAKGLDAALLARYDSLRETKHGIGVGILSNSMCSACRIDLPAERVQALAEGGPIGECPSCHRLLVVRQSEHS